MASVSTPYLSNFPSTRPVDLRVPSFGWAMLALVIVDIVLLFWVFNPMAKTDQDVRLTPPLSVTVEQFASSPQIEKPSPLGALAQFRRVATGRTAYRASR